MCKRKVIGITLKVFFVAITIIVSASPASTQTLTLSDCINLFERDTSFFKAFYIKNYDTEDTVYSDAGCYVVDRKSRISSEDYLHKVIFKDGSRNLLNFSFTDVEQLDELKKEFKLRDFNLINSAKDRKIGGKVNYYFDPKSKLDFGLVELKLKTGPFNARYSLSISRHK